MRDGSLFVLGFMLLSTLLHAQKLIGLISEEISEYQEYTADPDSWIPEYRIVYNYNPKGQKSYSRSMDWDMSQTTWKVVGDSQFEYDQVGHEIISLYKEYKSFPDLLSREIEEKNYYHNWSSPNYFEKSGSYRHVIDYENGEEKMYEQKCDQDTINHFSSCRYYSKHSRRDFFNESIRVYNSKSDGQSNIYWQSSWVTENDNGRKNEYYDSTVYYYEDISTHIPSQTDYYYRKPDESYQLIRQEKREYVYDDQENLIADRTYQKLPGEDWEILYESLHTYDSLGRGIEYLFIDFRNPFPHFSRKSISSYEVIDEEEIEILTRSFWHYELNDWIPSSKGGSITNENGWYTIYWDNWDEELGLFTYQAEEWLTWSENDTGRITTIHRKGWDISSQSEFDYIQEQGWSKRCDGNIDFSYDQIIEGTPEYDFQNRRTSYYYFDIPECEEGQPAMEITVFPNPSNGELNIYAEDRLGLSSIFITDAMGKLVFYDEKDLTNFTIIDLEGYIQGMYYLQVSNGELNYSGKFILAY